MTLTFVIPGDPQALKRHRSARRGERIVQYDPKENVDAKRLVRDAWCRAGHFSTPPKGEPLSVTLSCAFKRPQSHYRTGKHSQSLKATAARWHVARPDGDNLLKLLGDSLNGFAWHDDSQVAEWTVQKRYCEEDESPHTTVTVRSLGE